MDPITWHLACQGADMTASTPSLADDHRVADLSLNEFGRNEIRLADGLEIVGAEFVLVEFDVLVP